MDNNKIAGDTKFAIPYRNLLFVLIGLGLMILGYVFMAGGGTNDPNVFPGEKMFSFG